MNKKKYFDQVIAYYLRTRELVVVDVCATRLRGGTSIPDVLLLYIWLFDTISIIHKIGSKLNFEKKNCYFDQSFNPFAITHMP